jgi:F0F1-type ATP synthase assembly protein I
MAKPKKITTSTKQLAAASVNTTPEVAELACENINITQRRQRLAIGLVAIGILIGLVTWNLTDDLELMWWETILVLLTTFSAAIGLMQGLRKLCVSLAWQNKQSTTLTGWSTAAVTDIVLTYRLKQASRALIRDAIIVSLIISGVILIAFNLVL